MKKELLLKEVLVDLAATPCEFVVIGSSALAIQGWDISPSDLDLFTTNREVERLVDQLGVDEGETAWVEDGEARRLECATPRGPVDLYVDVSGGLDYEIVVRDAVQVMLVGAPTSIRVGSLEHVRDMRAAAGRSLVPGHAVSPAAREGVPRVIAIDGPAGAGKSTVTRAVARELGLTYLDTGAMYRSVALAVLERRADTDDQESITAIAGGIEIEFRGERVFLDGADVTDAIREADVTVVTPHIAAYPEVREAMVRRQRELFSQGAYVAEGRDTGTVVAPDAPLKIYLTASAEERARRRSRESGEEYEAVLAAINERDRLDSGRELSALQVAEDAIVIDTTGRPVREIVAEIAELARERGIL